MALTEIPIELSSTPSIVDGGNATAITISSAELVTVANGLTLTDGNVVVANGHGIDFSATSGSGTSELLDDYEEGTWTPALAAYYGTYGTTLTQGTRSGFYNKVGNLVTLSMEISSAGVAAANNGDIIVITGLPFALLGGPVGSHAHTSIASFAGGGWTPITTTQLGHLGNNGTSSNVWTWLTGPNVATAGVAIRLSISYRTS